MLNFKKEKAITPRKRKVEFIGEEDGLETCGQVFKKGQKYKVDQGTHAYLKKNFRTIFKL